MIETNEKCQQCTETCKQFYFIKVVVCPNFKSATLHTGGNTLTAPETNDNKD